MSPKPGKMYREVKGQPYTRKEYIGGVPHIRVGQFTMGNKTADFDSKVTLIAEERCQIKDAALEAARVTLTRVLTKSLGEENFKAKILVYPHHILRENKQATGAGADRLSEGMRRSFGKKVGSAARVDPNQDIISVWTDEGNIDAGKEALRKASMKLPTPCRKKVE